MTTTNIKAKLDSGATSHYFREHDTSALKNIKNIQQGPKILLPNGSKIEIKQQGKLKIPEAPNIDQEVNIVPKLTSASLLSVGKFMDDGCEAYFTKDRAIILKANKPILQGFRNVTDG